MWWVRLHITSTASGLSKYSSNPHVYSDYFSAKLSYSLKQPGRLWRLVYARHEARYLHNDGIRDTELAAAPKPKKKESTPPFSTTSLSISELLMASMDTQPADRKSVV